MEKPIAKTHIHIITYRGTLPFNTYNRLIKFLYDNKIKYITQSKLSPTRDDAGLDKYYDRVIFWHSDYIKYVTNRGKLSIADYINKMEKK